MKKSIVLIFIILLHAIATHAVLTQNQIREKIIDYITFMNNIGFKYPQPYNSSFQEKASHIFASPCTISINDCTHNYTSEISMMVLHLLNKKEQWAMWQILEPSLSVDERKQAATLVYTYKAFLRHSNGAHQQKIYRGIDTIFFESNYIKTINRMLCPVQ